MYNSKYSGATVEALLDAVSGKTIYEAGDGITIVGGVISSTGGGGGGGDISQEEYDSFQKAAAKLFTDQNDTNKELAAQFANFYTKSESEAKFIDQSELTNALLEFMRSDAYHAIHDPQEHAIAAGLNDLDSRVTTLEQDSGGSTPVDLSAYYTSAETLNAIATASAATVTAIEGMNYATTAVTSALETRIAALEQMLLVVGQNSAYTIAQMTEAEYSAATKNANTIYYVTSGATA